MEVEYIQRLDQMDTRIMTQHVIGHFAHGRIEVNGIYDLGIRKLVHQPFNHAEHLPHAVPQIFPAVGCQQNQAIISDTAQHVVLVRLGYRRFQRVNRRIPRNKDRIFRFVLIQQISRRLLSRSKMQVRHDTG